MANGIPDIPLPGGQTERLPTPFDKTSITPEQFGSGLGRGLAVAAEGLDRVYAQADATAAQEAETRYSKQILDQVYGTTDPDTGEAKPGFGSLKGHDALAASASLAKQLEDGRNEIASTLANDRQRRIFLGRTQGELLGALRSIESHTSEQVAFLQREGLKTRLEVAAQGAASTVVTPGGQTDIIGASRQIDAMREWLEIAAEQQGLKGGDAERFVREGQGGVAKAVLERLLEDPREGGRGHSQDAKAFLEANRDILDPKTAAQFAARVGPAEIRDRSLVEADRIWAEAEGDPAKAEAAVRAITETPLRDAVQTRIGQRLEQDRSVRLAADSPREARLETLIYQGFGLDRNSQDYQALSDEGKSRVEAKLNANQRADRSEQRQADNDAWWSFKALPLGGRQGQDQNSISIDQSPLFAGASPAMRNKIRAEQTKARAEWAKDNGVGRDTFMRQARAIADQLGWLGSEAPGAPSKRANFLRAMTTAYDSWLTDPANAGASVVPPERVRAIFNEALRYGDLSGSRFNLSKNRYAWEAAKQGAAVEFTTQGFPEQPGLAAAERVLGPGPAAPRTVRLRGPNGEGWTAPASPDLDAWIRSHPGWRVE